MRRTGYRQLLRSFSVLALVAAGVSLTSPKSAVGAVSALRDIGFMPYGFDSPKTPPPQPGLVVDAGIHRGFVVHQGTLFVYDLRSMALEASLAIPGGLDNARRPYAAVDTAHHRIFWTLSPRSSVDCQSTFVAVLDTQQLTWSVRPMSCLKSGPIPIVLNGISYDAVHDRLYVVGYPSVADVPYSFASGLLQRQPAVIAELNPDTLEVTWDVDVSSFCDWHERGALSTSATVARTGDTVLLFCLQGGPNRNAGGARGSVLRIPLHNGNPAKDGLGQHVISVVGAYSDVSVRVIVDPATSRVMLVSGQLPFGPALWVFDAQRGAFVGVLPTGVDPNTLEGFDFGFDQVAGRFYLHSSRGFVLADVRHTPLPGGVSFDTGAGPILPTHGALEISLDSGLKRLFVVDEERRGWRVFEDRLPPPPKLELVDPDRGTADIPEKAGETDTTYSATGTAYGARVLNVGGIPSALQQATARADCRARPFGREGCAVSMLVSPGNREYFLGQTSVGFGKSAGGSAFATAGRASPRDFATDADARSIGLCYADRVDQLYSGGGTQASGVCQHVEPLANSLAGGPLEGFTLEGFRGGTTPRGDPSKDFPIPSSYCNDFGDAPHAPTTEDRPFTGATRSTVACDAEKGVLVAEAEIGTTSLPASGSIPALAFTRAKSTLSTALTADGMASTAEAVAEGVAIGDLVHIGRVATRATAVARGRSGSAMTSFDRHFEFVTAPGFSCAEQCDPRQVAEGISRAFSGLVAVRVPEPRQVATPRGFTAYVAKDPNLFASDGAINDDDSVTVNALDLIVVNDYARGAGADGQQNAGRSRFIVSLAGVQVESHYGVFPLPRTEDGVAPGGGPFDALASIGNELVLPYINPQPRPHIDPTPPRPVPAVNNTPGPAFPRTVAEAVRLVVNNPREAALLAFFLAILAAPVYLAVRRRLVASVWQT